MPLSEQEQRLLDEMERHLMNNDADVVSAPTGDRVLSYRNMVYGVVLVLLGIAALIVAVAVSQSVHVAVSIGIGVVAFVAMVSGAILAFTPVKSSAPQKERPSASKVTQQASFMDRMNDRWDRRQDGR